jgi:hypothetical protein
MEIQPFHILKVLDAIFMFLMMWLILVGDFDRVIKICRCGRPGNGLGILGWIVFLVGVGSGAAAFITGCE